jgi:hypothetical protein
MDLTGIPHAVDIEREARRLGLPVRGPAGIA